MNLHSKLADLSQIKVCYCDSEAAWRLAVKDGLSPNAIIRTTNPALLMNPPSGATVEPVERTWTPEKIEALIASVDGLCMGIRQTIGRSAFRAYVDLLVRDAFIWSYCIPWAITLNNADLTEPRAIISVDYGNAIRHANGHARWAELLATNPHLASLIYQSDDCGLASQSPPRFPTRKQLLKYYPYSHLEYAFWRRLWRTLPRSLSRGTLYVGIDNPGIRETLVHFARRGYAICETIRPSTSGKRGGVPDELRAMMTPLLRNHLAPWVKPGIQNTLIALFFDDLANSIGAYEEVLLQWTSTISGWKTEKPVALFSNIIFPNTVLPLRKCLRDAGVPLVLFQHGHSRELTKYLEHNRCILEDTLADVFVCFDDKAKEFSSANPHRTALVVMAGVPDIYHTSPRYIPDEECGDIGYIQTVIPVSNRAHPLAMTWTDLSKDKFETRLFKECFAQLPYTVTVKPYMAPDYPGMRRSIEILKKSPNLNLYSKEIDFRYIAGNFRLIVTSRATSTLGWCVLANRPLVYLDLPYQYPLWDDAREALKESVFYFDMGKSDAFDRLRDFLSQPLEVIEQQWLEREQARIRFIGRYLDSGSGGFGKRAYMGIKKYLKTRMGRVALKDQSRPFDVGPSREDRSRAS